MMVGCVVGVILMFVMLIGGYLFDVYGCNWIVWWMCIVLMVVIYLVFIVLNCWLGVVLLLLIIVVLLIVYVINIGVMGVMFGELFLWVVCVMGGVLVYSVGVVIFGGFV